MNNQYLMFQLVNTLYAIEISHVKKIILNKYITVIPNTLACVLGVINLHGTLIPIVDLKKHLNLFHQEDTAQTIIIMKHLSVLIGVLSDTIPKVLNISSSAIIEAPLIMSRIEKNYISATIRMNTITAFIINVNKVLSAKEPEIIHT